MLTVQHAVPSRLITNAEVIANVRRATARYGDATILALMTVLLATASIGVRAARRAAFA